MLELQDELNTLFTLEDTNALGTNHLVPNALVAALFRSHTHAKNI